MKKRAIVAESPRPAGSEDAGRAPGPLEGATFVIGAAAPAQLPPAGPPEVALAGRSNVGKSSALNALARRTRLAHASRTPGRTRQINFFRLRGGALVADLPGYGYAAVPRALKASWQDFLWDYVRTRSPLIGLVLLVDARHGLKSLDLELLAAFLPSGRPVLVLATKSDKLNIAERRSAVAGIERAIHTVFPDHAGTTSVVAFSATSGQGVVEADQNVAQWLGL